MSGGAADGVVVRPAGKADVEPILRLLERCLGPGPTGARDRAFWEWKHLASPFGPSPCLVADAGGEPVAVRAFLCWRLRCSGQGVEAVRAVDTATDPRWRGRGLFSRLTVELAADLERQGVACVFNTPNRASLPGYLRQGWKPVGRLPLRLRPPALGRRSAPVKTTVADLLAERGLLEALDLDPPTGRLGTDRTLPYLAWRYRDPPRLRYGALWERSGSDAAAVVFRHRRRRRWHETSVAEVLTTPGEDSGALAVRLLRRLAATRGSGYLAALDSERLRPILRRAGFWCLGAAGPLLTVRKLAWGVWLPDPWSWRSWDWSLGDLELF